MFTHAVGSPLTAQGALSTPHPPPMLSTLFPAPYTQLQGRPRPSAPAQGRRGSVLSAWLREPRRAISEGATKELGQKCRERGPGPRKPPAPRLQPAQDGHGGVRWEVSLEQSLGTLRSPEAGGQAGRWGTAAASVLGDLAVVFRMDVPAQADGQEHPQELSGQRARVRGRHGHPGPPEAPGQHLTVQVSEGHRD